MLILKRKGAVKKQSKNERFEVCHLEHLRSLTGLPLASFKSRSVAYAIDLAIIGILNISVNLKEAISYFQANSLTEVSAASKYIDDLVGVAALVLYFGIITYYWHGQTIGKHLMKIRVISLKKEKLTRWQSIERSLGYGASALEAGFGFFQVIWDENRQAVHDRIAETAVIKVQ